MLVPMIIIYKVSLFTWLIAKMFVKIKFIGMVNIIAEKAVVPEFIQYSIKPARIATIIRETIENEVRYNSIKKQLKDVRHKLGEPGASGRAAEEILNIEG